MCTHGFREFSNGLVLKYWIKTICLLLENHFQTIMFTETFLQFSPLSLIKISHCSPLIGCKKNTPEAVFVDLLRSPGIDSRMAGRYDKPIWRAGRSLARSMLARSLESIPGLLKCLHFRALASATFRTLFRVIPKYWFICRDPQRNIINFFRLSL